MKIKKGIEPCGGDYLELVKRFPLQVIRKERELDAAAEMALALAIKGEKQLSKGEVEYLDVLDRLIEDYEQTHFPVTNRT